jgi:hypothetical protein
MYRNFFLVLVFTLTVVSCSPAIKPAPTHHLSIDKHLQLAMVLPSPRWQLSEEPPGFFAQKMTDHLRQEVSAFKPDIEDKQLLLLAQKRLAVNEGYVFNRHTGALLMIDFSLRRENKDAPTLSELQASAHGSLLVLENEEGVTDLKSRIGSLTIDGGSRASKMEATYSLDGKPQLFMGIIGFMAPYRFYLYYNDSLEDPQDRIEMNIILNSLQLLQGPPER